MSGLVVAVGLAVCAFLAGDLGVERAMAAAPPSATSVTVRASITAGNFAQLDDAIRTRTTRALGVPAQVTGTFRSDGYAMPGQEKRTKPERLRFHAFDGFQEHARLVSGAWPRSRTEPVEAVISRSAAAYTGFTSGQVIPLLGRVEGKTVQVKITGIFALDDPYGTRWAEDQLLARGVEWDWYTTYGPLMVDRATFLDHFATQIPATWTFHPDLRGMSAAGLRELAARLTGLRAEFERNRCPDCTPVSALPRTLAGLDAASAAARWTLLALGAGLVLALLLASRPTLSVTLAAATVIVAISAVATWRTSGEDQDRFQAGADVRLSGDFEAGTAVAALPGVTAAAPGFRGQVEIDSGYATLLGIDRLEEVFRLRPNLSKQRLSEMAVALRAARPQAAAVPGKPRTLAVQVEQPDGPVPLKLVVSDTHGVWHHLALRAGANQVDVSKLAPPLTIRGFLAGRADGSPRAANVTSIRADGHDLPAGFTLRAGDSAAAVAAAPATAPLPIVISADLAASARLTVGKVATIALERVPVQVKVAGIVEHLPATVRGLPGILADWTTLQSRNLTEAKLPLPVTDWWLAGKPPRDLTVITRQDTASPLTVPLWWALCLTALAALLLMVSALARPRTAWFVPVGALAGVAVCFLAVRPLVRALQVPPAIPDVALVVPWLALGVLLAVATISPFRRRGIRRSRWCGLGGRWWSRESREASPPR